MYPPCNTCGIAVMAKASLPGRTKTRLVPPLRSSEAAALNTAFLQDIADNLLQAASVSPVVPYMAFSPPGAEPFFADILPRGIGLIESFIGDFGRCLRHAVAAQFSLGHGAACVLNSDSPTLPTSVLIDLADALAAPGDRAVLGPSIDGGYYVLGLKSPHRRLFEDIAWSTERVAAQTLARAAEIGLPVHVLPTWYDVDDAASLRILHGELFEDRPFANRALVSSPAEHTRALLSQWCQTSDLRGRRQLDGSAAGVAA